MFLKHFCISNSNLLLKPKRRNISQYNFTMVNYRFNISLCTSISRSTIIISSCNNGFNSSINYVGCISSSFSSYTPASHFHAKHTVDPIKTSKRIALNNNKHHILKRRLHHDIVNCDLLVTNNFKVKKKLMSYYKAKVKKKGTKLLINCLIFFARLQYYTYSKKHLNIQKILNCIRNKKEINIQKRHGNGPIFYSTSQEIVLSENVKKQINTPVQLPLDSDRPIKKKTEDFIPSEQNIRTKQNEHMKKKKNPLNDEPGIHTDTKPNGQPEHQQNTQTNTQQNTQQSTEWRKWKKNKRDHDIEGRGRYPKMNKNNKREKVETTRKSKLREKKNKQERSELYMKETAEKEERSADDKTEAKNFKMNDLFLVGLSGCIPFICFGFVDNSFMIIAGDLFDSTFCIFLGFSTMAAAGLGNLTSDVLGIFLGGYIEKVISCIGYPKINMTNKQLKMNTTRRYYYYGSAIGIALGCLLGMIPLLFIDSHKVEEKKNTKTIKQKNMNKSLFDLVSKELPQHMNSNHAFLFIVDKTTNNLYSYLNNKKIQLALDENCVLTEVHKKGKTVSYAINNQLINTTYVYKPNINQEEEKIIETNKKSKEDETETRIIQNTNSFFKKHEINIEQVVAVPLFDVNQSVIGVIVVINPKDQFCSNSKYIHFLNLLCSHIAHEVIADTDISQTLQLCKRVVYE